MPTNLRFSLYRAIVGLFTLLSFKSQRVQALRPPTETKARFRPFADAFPEMPLPGVFDAVDFPAADVPRLKRIALTKKMLSLAGRIAPRHTDPIPKDEPSFAAAVYPRWFRKAWGRPPQVPAEVDRHDVVASLAVQGPFASYLRAESDGTYTIDLSWMLDYDTGPGLLAPGGKATLAVKDGRLRTVALDRDGDDVPLADWRGRQLERDALLAGMNEDMTTFRHNISVHLTMLTSFALASTNHLGVDHPVRRLLHHCFSTVLIGNRELATAHLSGPQGFASTIFSHEAPELARMGKDYLGRYDFWDFEPDTQFARRGTTETPFAYPYRDNVLELWRATLAYAEAYMALYYADDAAVAGDAAVAAWLAALDELVPNGVVPPTGAGMREWLARLCATVIHASTVEHDYLNNVAWDYSTVGWLVPTVVPLSGERMDQRRALDMIATMIVTWKPYNMLLTSDVPSLALDDDGHAVMAGWIAELQRIQSSMPGGHPLAYPANLNVSISN